MSLASLWVFWKQHNGRAGYMVASLLLLAVGWQLGRITSPYYAANPIVFQEAPNNPPAGGNGSVEKLVALQQAGQAGTPVEALAKAGESPQVAAAITSAAPTPSPSIPSEGRLFVGSKNSNLYHHKDCPSAKQIKPENQVWWPTREAAEAAGYTPSKCTAEKLGNT